MKRIVLCCDGTWNSPDQLSGGQVSPTNITKLALMVDREPADGVRQVLHYDKGVGTGRTDRILGGVFGVGLAANVRRAYRFLVATYEPGDAIFVFGFSRGAFTARSLVGYVRNCGILRPEYADREDDAFALYHGRGDATHPRGIEARLFRAQYSHEAAVECVGVFDTVGALGIPLDGPRLVNRFNRNLQFHDTELSSTVRNAFHALSINGRRGPFRPTLWTNPPAPGQRLEQVWFSGVHCDIGGGYAESESALSGITLRWMAARAQECGLRFREGAFGEWTPDGLPDLLSSGELVDSRALGEQHRSRRGVYLAMAPYERTFGTSATGERVASSVGYRWDRQHDDDVSATFSDAVGRGADDLAEVAFQET